jgi:hypothetical protein
MCVAGCFFEIETDEGFCWMFFEIDTDGRKDCRMFFEIDTDGRKDTWPPQLRSQTSSFRSQHCGTHPSHVHARLKEWGQRGTWTGVVRKRFFTTLSLQGQQTEGGTHINANPLLHCTIQ